MTKIDWNEVMSIKNSDPENVKTTAKIQGGRTTVVVVGPEPTRARAYIEDQTLEEAYANYFNGQKEIFGRDARGMDR